MLVRNPFTHDSRVENEARTLVAEGYRVTVVAEGSNGLADREERDGVTIVRVRRRGTRLPGLRYVAYARRLRAALARTRPTILHAHDTDALVSVGPVAECLGVPFVYDAHELWLGRSRRGRSLLYAWLARAYYYRVEARYLGRAAGVVVANPPVAPLLQAAYRLPSVSIVPNYPQAPGALQAESLRSLPGGELIPLGAPIVLYLGGIAPERGIEQVIEAMMRLPDAHLAFLGSGGHEGEIRRLVDRRGLDERVHFLGAVPPDEVVAYAASGSVGVLSTVPVSINNVLALPNKIFQYMAAGIPVVASDFPQIRDVVVGSRAGLVVDPVDPVAIADALRRILADPARASEMGRAGRRAVEERYHWAEAARPLVELYQRIST